MSVVLIAGLLVFSGVLRRGNRRRTDPSMDYSAMALRVERTASELLLTWNRDSEPIRNATHAVLSIHDGTQDENVDLDLNQLRNGSIVYSPMTTDVVFQMKLTGKRPGSDYHRIGPVLEHAAVAHGCGRGFQAAGQAECGRREGAAPAAGNRPRRRREAPCRWRRRLGNSAPNRLPSGCMRPRRADASEEPALPGATLASAPVTAALNLGTHSIPAPATAPAGPWCSCPDSRKEASQGGQIQPAQILRRKDPEYPRLAKDSGAKGVVEMLATVGADGRVKSVKILKGHPLLQRAASDAVMQWVYSPAILNGTPIESQAQIVLNFVNAK